MAKAKPTIPANREELLYDFNATLKRVQKQHKDLDVSDFAAVLLPELIRNVPSAAFDPIQPWDEGIMYFNTEIGDDEIGELQHDLMRAHLNLDKDMPIRLNLCSTGGSVFAGLGAVSTIFDLQREGRKVNVHVQGLAASMASVIMQAADYRTIESTAHILLHKISYGMRGSADEHQEELEFTNNLHQSMFSIYSARTGKPVSYYFEKLKKTNWFMTAETALAEGLVDEVVPPPRFLPAKAEKPKKATKRAA